MVAEKNRRVIECALNKRLIFDIMRQMKSPSGICWYDLQRYYDGILHNSVSITI